MSEKDERAKARFYSYTMPVTESGCLIWMGSISPRGYGCSHFKGRSMQAHRAVWRHERGEIPAGMYICHKCDVPSCVNIDHLFMGTPTDNFLDMVKKGRKRIAKGERHARAKLTEAQVLEIKAALANGGSSRRLAEKYGIGEGAIYFIKIGRNWKHLNARAAIAKAKAEQS